MLWHSQTQMARSRSSSFLAPCVIHCAIVFTSYTRFSFSCNTHTHKRYPLFYRSLTLNIRSSRVHIQPASSLPCKPASCFLHQLTASSCLPTSLSAIQCIEQTRLASMLKDVSAAWELQYLLAFIAADESMFSVLRAPLQSSGTQRPTSVFSYVWFLLYMTSWFQFSVS